MSNLLGSAPNQVPTNGDLGTLAFQDSNAVKITGGSVIPDTLGINATPTESASTNSTHKVPITLNGTVYYILLTNA